MNTVSSTSTLLPSPVGARIIRTKKVTIVAVVVGGTPGTISMICTLITTHMCWARILVRRDDSRDLKQQYVKEKSSE